MGNRQIWDGKHFKSACFMRTGTRVKFAGRSRRVPGAAGRGKFSLRLHSPVYMGIILPRHKKYTKIYAFSMDFFVILN